MVSQWLDIVPVTGSSERFIDGSPLDAQIFAGLLLAGLIVLITRRRRARALLRENGPLLAFILYCGLSILWSDYPFVSFKRWTKEIGDLVMVLVVLTDPDPPAALRRVLARSAFVLIPLSILLIR